jgi:hypothetical protein
MAKITTYIPEPKEQYEVDNQRQILAALDTLKNELNLDIKKIYKMNKQDWSGFLVNGKFL